MEIRQITRDYERQKCLRLVLSKLERCTDHSIDPDIEAKLDALEEEERRLEEEGFYDSDEEIVLPPLPFTTRKSNNQDGRRRARTP